MNTIPTDLDKQFTEYKIIQRRGIDDLLPEYAFSRSWGQGDHSTTNNVQEYLASQHDFPYQPIFKDVDPTDQTAIDIEIENRRIANLLYKAELRVKGNFGEEYEITINLQSNPMFDNSITTPAKGPALESYRMVFLDFDESKGANDQSAITTISIKDKYGKL